MEKIICEIDKAIVERRKIYTLHNGIEIKLPTKLTGNSIEKRIAETRLLAENLFSTIQQLKLI